MIYYLTRPFKVKYCNRTNLSKWSVFKFTNRHCPYKAMWRIPKLILKACTINFVLHTFWKLHGVKRILTLKWLGGQFDFLCSFSKNVSFREKVKPCFFVTFKIIISHIFTENFIETPEVVQKIWRFSLSILTIFINFSDFLTIPCYKETNNVII